MQSGLNRSDIRSKKTAKLIDAKISSFAPLFPTDLVTSCLGTGTCTPASGEAGVDLLPLAPNCRTCRLPCTLMGLDSFRSSIQLGLAPCPKRALPGKSRIIQFICKKTGNDMLCRSYNWNESVHCWCMLALAAAAGVKCDDGQRRCKDASRSHPQ